MSKTHCRWLWIILAYAGLSLWVGVPAEAQTERIEATQFPVLTKTQSDSIDPSLPEASPASPADAPPITRYAMPDPPPQPAVPINGDVAAEIARQLAETKPGAGDAPKPQKRIYAVREPAGSFLATGEVRPLPALIAPAQVGRTMPPAAAQPVIPVDETAVLDRMLTMNRSQVMRGVTDVVNHTGGARVAMRPVRRSRESARVEAQPLHPATGSGMRRIDPDPPATPVKPILP